MFKSVALLLLWSSLLYHRFTVHAVPPRRGVWVLQKEQSLKDILGLWVCGGPVEDYLTHNTTLHEFDIENLSNKISYQLWIESGTRCQKAHNGAPLGNITWSTSTEGDEVCSTLVERSALNGGIQRYLRAYPKFGGLQCLLIIHGDWKGYAAFSTEKGPHSAYDHDCTGFGSQNCILSGRNDCQGLFC